MLFTTDNLDFLLCADCLAKDLPKVKETPIFTADPADFLDFRCDECNRETHVSADLQKSYGTEGVGIVINHLVTLASECKGETITEIVTAKMNTIIQSLRELQVTMA